MPGQDDGNRRIGRLGRVRKLLTGVGACAFLAVGFPLAALVMARYRAVNWND
jgi:hypothetical protein